MDILKSGSSFLILLLAFTLNVKAQDSGLTEAFRKSYSLEKDGEYAKAANVLKASKSENHYYISLRLGWLMYMAGSFQESAAHYKKAIQQMPLSIEARLGLVLPLSAMGNWDQVVTQYLEILKTDPKNSTANYRLAMIYYNRSDFQKAFRHLEIVVNHYPFDYDSLILFAWTHLKLGKLSEARVLFQNALLYNPDDTSAKEGLGMIK